MATTVSTLGYIQRPTQTNYAYLTTIDAPDSVATTAAGSSITITPGSGYDGATASAAGDFVVTGTTGGAGTTTGGVGSDVTVASGTGGTGTTTGGASGAISLTTGAGGVGATGGTAADITLTAGAGAATNGGSGSIRLITSSPNGTGVQGCIFKRAAAITATAASGDTLTANECLSLYIVLTGAVGNVTTPTGTLLSAAIPNVAVGDIFELFVDADGATGILTLVAGASGMTVIGTGAIPDGVGAVIRFINTAANTWKALVVPAV